MVWVEKSGQNSIVMSLDVISLFHMYVDFEGFLYLLLYIQMIKVVFGVFAQQTCQLSTGYTYLFISTTVVSSKQQMQITMYCIFVL